MKRHPGEQSDSKVGLIIPFSQAPFLHKIAGCRIRLPLAQLEIHWLTWLRMGDKKSQTARLLQSNQQRHAQSRHQALRCVRFGKYSAHRSGIGT